MDACIGHSVSLRRQNSLQFSSTRFTETLRAGFIVRSEETVFKDDNKTFTEGRKRLGMVEGWASDLGCLENSVMKEAVVRA